MKFSIIIPIYNVEKYLKKCLSSVVNQTYKNFEVIIVIDKCDDNSEKIADKYIKKYGWTKIYEEHTGLAKARNIGIQKATGDYIVLLDSDDYLENDFLETINKALNLDYDNSSIQVILAFVSLISVGGVISYKVLRGKNIKEASKILGIPESFITE